MLEKWFAGDRRLYIWLAVISGLGAILRFWPNPFPYMDLDAAIYARAANAYAHALHSHLLFAQELRDVNYAAVEYWPPLYPMLAGLINSPVFLAEFMGWLTIFPVFFLGKRLFSEEGDAPVMGNFIAVIAGTIVALHPYLVWWTRVPRSESLYIFLISSAMLCVLPLRHKHWLWLVGGGSCVGLAYSARFDGLAFFLSLLLAVCWQRRSLKAAALLALGFALAAAPYLGYLAHLNGGALTFITPKKNTYDTLEGVYAVAMQRPLYEFTKKYGLPGMYDFSGSVHQINIIREKYTPLLIWTGIKHIPATLMDASRNWLALLAPLVLSLGALKQRRIQALWLCCLPVLGMAVFMFWDPNSRYYAFSLVPLSIISAQGLYILGTSPAPGAVWRWAVCGALIPLSLAFAWVMPSVVHFDKHAPTDAMFLELLPNASVLHLQMVALCFALAAVLIQYISPLATACIATAAAIGISWGYILPALQNSAGLFRTAVPWGLLLFSLFPLCVFGTMPCSMWGERVSLWFVGLFALSSLYGIFMLNYWGMAQARLNYCPEIGESLSELVRSGEAYYAPPGAHPGFGNSGPRVMASQTVDLMRSGARWLPFADYDSWCDILYYEKPKYVILTLPEPDAGLTGLSVDVPEIADTGEVKLLRRVRSWGSDATCSRWWCLYGYIGDGRERRQLPEERRKIFEQRRMRLRQEMPEADIFSD